MDGADHLVGGLADQSYAVPTGGVFGTSATDLFCSGVAAGSKALTRLVRNPLPLLLLLAALGALIVYATVKATWTPVAPLRLGRRRSWGQILAASGRMYVKRPRLFLGLGLLFLPIVVVITLLQWLIFELLDLVGAFTGEVAGGGAFLALVVGTTLTLLGFTFVQAATACALVELDAGRPVGPLAAYRLAFERIRPLLGATAIAVFVVDRARDHGGADPRCDLAGHPLGPPRARRRARGSDGGRRDSPERRARQGRWIRVGSLVGLGAGIALAAGPLIGALLIFATDAPFALLNVVAGVVYALALPFVALTTAYVYFDARARLELEPVDRPDELPAEIELGRA